MGMYTVLSILFMFLVRREIEHGPEGPPSGCSRLMLDASAKFSWRCDSSCQQSGSDRSGDGRGVRRAGRLRPGRGRAASVRRDERRGAPQRSCAPSVRCGTATRCGCWPPADALLCLSAAVCLGLQRLLSAADDGAVAADAAGIGIEFRAHTRRSQCGKDSSTSSSQWRVFCWRSSSARRWATWCAAFR